MKAWVDHLVVPGVSVDPETGEGLLGGAEFIVLAARGGGYAPGTPRDSKSTCGAGHGPDPFADARSVVSSTYART